MATCSNNHVVPNGTVFCTQCGEPIASAQSLSNTASVPDPYTAPAVVEPVVLTEIAEPTVPTEPASVSAGMRLDRAIGYGKTLSSQTRRVPSHKLAQILLGIAALWFLISLVVGLHAFGLDIINSPHGFAWTSHMTFGADFYTESQNATADAARNVSLLADYIGDATNALGSAIARLLGFLVISSGFLVLNSAYRNYIMSKEA